MKMAQRQPDQHLYHPRPQVHPNQQLQMAPQFQKSYNLHFDERTGAINYNHIRPYIPNQTQKPKDLSDSLVVRRPRQARTTFTSAQVDELEYHFKQDQYLTTSTLFELSAKLALGTSQIKIWYKNRRRRHKIESDHQKELLCDEKQLSPPVLHFDQNNTYVNASGSSATLSEAPSNSQSLSLNRSAGSETNASPPQNSPPIRRRRQNHRTHALLTHPYSAASTQHYNPSPPSSDENITKLLVTVDNNDNDIGDTYSNESSTGSEGYVTPAIYITATDMKEANHHYTMDTPQPAYSKHRNTSTNVQQFATYCFN